MAGAAERAAIRRATLRAQRAVEDLDAETAQALIDLYTQTADDIAARLMVHAGADDTLTLAELRSALTQIEARLAELARARDGLLMESLERAATWGAEAAAGGVATAATMRVSHEALAFIQTFVAEDGLQLSDRLWRLDRGARDRVVNAIEQAVIQGWGAEQAARALLGQGKPVPAELRDKAKAADAAALGRQVDELMTGAGSPMDNAMRVMRTEINRAHGEAYMMGGEDKPWFGGWRFLLSPSHPKPDICDLLSEQNLYGLGKGVYPDRERLPWPAHPNTLSFVTMVFKDEITAADRAGQETPMAALSRLSPERREGVLGKGKAELYEAGKLTQGMIRAPLKDALSRARAAGLLETPKTAYDAGGKHHGWYLRQRELSGAEIARGIRSFERQIARHENWIADPLSKTADFQTFDPRRQAALIDGWRNDVARHQASIEILRGILRERENG